MTPAAQNIAIAESLGWKLHGHYWKCPNYKKGDALRMLPNYLNDLNACHEFEQTLTDKEYVKFSSGLDDIVTRDAFAAGTKPPFGLPATMLRHYSATAPQRCEAYLRTKGLWDDSK